MRFFKAALAATAVAAFGFAGAFAQAENTVITGIQSVTTASATLQVTISELNAVNFPIKGFVSGFSAFALSPMILTP